MNVTITNINQETLQAIEILLKPFVQKDNMRIIKDDETEIKNAIDYYENEKRLGKTKVYDTFADFKKAMSV